MKNKSAKFKNILLNKSPKEEEKKLNIKKIKFKSNNIHQIKLIKSKEEIKNESKIIKEKKLFLKTLNCDLNKSASLNYPNKNCVIKIKKNYINYLERKRIKQEGKILSNQIDSIFSPIQIQQNINTSLFLDQTYHQSAKNLINKFKKNNKYFFMKDIFEKILNDINPSKRKFSFGKNKVLSNSFNNTYKTPKNIIYSKNLEDQTIIMLKKPSENIFDENLLLSKNKKSNKEVKRNIKLKLLRYLWKYYPSEIEILIKMFLKFKWYFLDKNIVNQEHFEEFINVSGINIQNKIINQLFLIFAKTNENNLIDINQMQIELILTSVSHKFEDKILMILDLFENNDNLIDVKKLLYIFENFICNEHNHNYINYFYEQISLKYSQDNFKRNIMILLKNRKSKNLINFKNLKINLIKEIMRDDLQNELLNNHIISDLYQTFFKTYLNIINDYKENLSSLIHINDINSITTDISEKIKSYDRIYYESLCSILKLHDKYSYFKEFCNKNI